MWVRISYERTGGQDGFVSIEVSPYLAHDTEQTLAEVRRFWRAIDRPNLMVKIPSTAAGISAIRQSLYTLSIKIQVNSFTHHYYCSVDAECCISYYYLLIEAI